MASDLDTYTHLPLQYDPQTKTVTAPTSKSRTLAAELDALNALHRSLLSLSLSPDAGGPGSASGVPPPPVPVNPKRSANVTKLRESGNGEVRRGRPAEAARLYGLGLQMALGRPPWEPQGLAREEAAALYANRAQARMALQRWAEAAVDAEASVEAKRAGNGKAWWRRGRCLLEMGRLEEAREWVGRGLELEGGGGGPGAGAGGAGGAGAGAGGAEEAGGNELAALMREVEARLARERGREQREQKEQKGKGKK